MAQTYTTGQLASALANIQAVVRKQNAVIAQLQSTIINKPRSVEEEIDSIPGRRIEACLCGGVQFDATDEGQRGLPVIMQVPQDGPFIQTHYPLVLWRPIAPTDATNLNIWRPVSSFPLPDQVVDTDIIDLKYEMADGGNGRFFQNAPRGPLFSRPDNLIPVPVKTLWAPNTALNFIPTYLALTWNGSTPPTQGELYVTIPGFHIVNL